MKYTVKKEKSEVTLEFKADAAEWKEAESKAYSQTKGKYAVPGFRKGHAPKHVIEQYYGAGVFADDAMDIIIQSGWDKFLDENEKKGEEALVPVDRPSANIVSMDDKGVKFTLKFPVTPEVNLGEYKGIKIPKIEYNVSEEDVDAELKRIAERGAKIEEKDGAAENGDIVNLDYSGSVDGVKFDGGEAEGFDLTLGSGQFIPGFEDQVVGMNIGDKKDVNVKFPENYQAESLKGKDAVFAVKLNSIKGKELPELTDAFIKDATGSETIEEYKQKTRERLQKQADKNALDATENSILEAISATAEAEIPQAMIEREIDGLVQKFEYQLMYQGLKLQDYLDFIKVSKEDFRKNYEEQAKKNVLNQLIISQIIKDEKIEATAEEVDAKVAEQAASVDKSAEEYKKSMDPRQFDYIKSDIIITKLFDFLKANNEMYREENKE